MLQQGGWMLDEEYSRLSDSDIGVIHEWYSLNTSTYLSGIKYTDAFERRHSGMDADRRR